MKIRNKLAALSCCLLLSGCDEKYHSGLSFNDEPTVPGKLNSQVIREFNYDGCVYICTKGGSIAHKGNCPSPEHLSSPAPMTGKSLSHMLLTNGNLNNDFWFQVQQRINESIDRENSLKAQLEAAKYKVEQSQPERR